MLSVCQNVGSGTLDLTKSEPPQVQPGKVLIANQASLISAGTEKMVMDFAKKSLLAKAKERPDQVRRVLEKVQTDGPLETFRQVRQRLDDPLTLGYSSAGVVIGCGEGVEGFQIGDRVASNGPHASVVSVPVNLVARVPDTVNFEQASFAVLGSIALQGVRLSKCVLGETAFVVGLGLVGQMTVGLLHAAGCRVIGTDPDPKKCELAKASGAEVARPGLTAAQATEITGGLGPDSVILTASTASNGPIELACEAVRQKGRIVLVGVVGLEMPRRPMFFKEAEFVVSCSYGPGRYDSNYEDRGIDYPAAHVRWTEQRNMQSVLDLLGRDQLRVDHLVTHKFEIEKAVEAYSMVREATEPYLGIVLKYPNHTSQIQSDTPPVELGSFGTAKSFAPALKQVKGPKVPAKPRLAVLGVGNFAKITMLPAVVRSAAFENRVLCSAGGVSAEHARKKFQFANASAAGSDVLASDDTDAVMILTRHDLHATQTIRGLDHGKHVFVEKPLAMTTSELVEIKQAVERNPSQILTVGYNRRFSAAAKRAKTHFEHVTAPMTVQYRFNAGAIPADSWVQHPQEGGGRIIGEACHAIDLVTYLAGSLPVEIHAMSIGGANAPSKVDDQAFMTIRHANGSVSSVGYLAGGARSMPKERVEVFSGGRSCVIDDFKSVTCYASGKSKRTKIRSGKGHLEEIQEFARAIETGEWPISWPELEATSVAAIAAVQSLRTGAPVRLLNNQEQRVAA
ncbi:Alcohol dehydrogenase [Roseimaritima multifibrata]|uniref:Alcohol dehydrogenase n=1 Tax=Roseimaritima multifibrata TaxID=1930274 RepID=A0A517MM25_9BACT|nr:bi-domain-containing oxidoreductase [Roseimaritima multifibrata]QDS95817.1 Alcohol dehydrogenase [Roseimaritima multifibrata]